MGLSRNICIFVSVYISFSCAYVDFSVYPSVFPAGKRNVSFNCDSLFFLYGEELKNESLKIQLRNNTNDNWTTVIELNSEGLHRKNENTFFNSFTILPVNGMDSYRREITLRGIVESKQCTVDLQKSPGARCVLSSESGIIDSSERSIFSIEGRTPETMKNISIVPRGLFFQEKEKINFVVDDVLQLQCIGEVESINGIPSKDIRWCKNESGKFQVLSLQHPPLTSIVSTSEDGCSVVQKSVIFYHISQNDTEVELMCESGYGGTCGRTGINLTLSIPTSNTNKDEWKVSPIIIHDKKFVLNRNLVELTGAGKTINLLCIASTLSQQVSLKNKVRWCFKKQVNETWAKMGLQERKIETVSNSSGETIIISKIKYHVTIFDNDIFFMCELSRYSRCGSGLASATTNISVSWEKILVNDIEEVSRGSDDIQLQKFSEHDCNKAGVATVSVLLVSILIIAFLFMMVLVRKKEIKFWGFVLKIAREDKMSIAGGAKNETLSALPVTTKPSKRYVEKPFGSVLPKKKEKGASSKKADAKKEIQCGGQDLYENQVFQDKGNVDTCAYEEVAVEQCKSEYETLRL